MDEAGLCCGGGMTLQSGAKVIAVIQIVLDVFVFSSVTFYWIMIGNPLKDDIDFKDFTGIFGVVYCAAVIILIIDTSMWLSLFRAAGKGNEKRLKTWLYYAKIIITLHGINIILTVANMFRRPVPVIHSVLKVMQIFIYLGYLSFSINIVRDLLKHIQTHPESYLRQRCLE